MSIKTIVLLAIAVFAINSSMAQVNHPDTVNKILRAYWIGAGLGASSEDLEGMVNLNAELGHR